MSKQIDKKKNENGTDAETKSQYQDKIAQEENLNAEADATPTYAKGKNILKLTGKVNNKTPMNNGGGKWGAAFFSGWTVNDIDDDGMPFKMDGTIIIQWPTPTYGARKTLHQEFKKFRGDDNKPKFVTISVNKVQREDETGKLEGLSNFTVDDVIDFEGTGSRAAIDISIIGENNLQ